MLLRRFCGDVVGAQCPGGGGGSSRQLRGMSQLETEDTESSKVSDCVSEFRLLNLDLAELLFLVWLEWEASGLGVAKSVVPVDALRLRELW